MSWALRVSTLLVLAMLLSAAGGCMTTLSANGFIAKYTNNIEVPNPYSDRLPTRTFLGEKGGEPRYLHLRDQIPPRQGGGLFGKVVNWRCPVAELPKDFPVGYCPGDVILDGRPGSPHKYMIQGCQAAAAARAAAASQATAPKK